MTDETHATDADATDPTPSEDPTRAVSKAGSKRAVSRGRGRPFNTRVEDVEPPAPEPEPEKPARKAREGGNLLIRYEGAADRFEAGPDGIVFRPGEAVEVPTEVAEDLLTMPGETFVEVVDEDDAPEDDADTDDAADADADATQEE